MVRASPSTPARRRSPSRGTFASAAAGSTSPSSRTGFGSPRSRPVSRASRSRCRAASFRWEALSVVGPLGDGLFRKVNVQKAFLGAAGFSLESGLSDATEEEAQIKRSMADAAQEVMGSSTARSGAARRSPPSAGCRTCRPSSPTTPRLHPPWPRSGLAGSRSTSRAHSTRARPPTRRRGWSDDDRRTGRRPGAAALTGVSMRFGATQALDDVSLELRPGEIHGLVGENGAGKSTLVKILAGVHQPDAGELLDGGRSRSTARHRPARSASRSSTRSRAVPRPDGRGERVPGSCAAGRARRDRLERDAPRIAGSPDSAFAWTPARRAWPVDGRQQMIEIAKSLSLEARVLILDEPTASLSAHEVERLFAIVRRTRARGVAVLFVSHRLDEVSSCAIARPCSATGNKSCRRRRRSLTPAE